MKIVDDNMKDVDSDEDPEDEYNFIILFHEQRS